VSDEAVLALVGNGAAPGRASGRAHIVDEADEMRPVPRGSILVARIIHPHLAPLLTRVAGLVVEEGSLLQHATTLAREFSLPAVVGLRGATTLVWEGDVIEMDGNTGIVNVRERQD
jgi:phosphohistidine swiveling domain-containing protein